MILPNGTKIVFVERNREMTAHFKYDDQIFSFDFWAARWDENLDPRDYWEVFLGFSLESLSASQMERLNLDEVRRIAVNIERALREWPGGKLESQVAIKEVRFLMTPWKHWRSQGTAYLARRAD